MADSLILTPAVMDGAVCVPLERNATYWFQTWEQGFCCWKSEEGGGPRSTVFPYRIIHKSDSNRLNKDLNLLFSVAHGLNMTQSEPGHYAIGIDTEKLGRTGKDGMPAKLIPFYDLMMAVPEDMRVLASQCGKRHYLALEAMRHVPRFADFLAQEVNGAGLNFALAAWALGKAMEQPKIFRLELAQRMMSMPRVQVLEMLTDQPCPNALLHLIEKMPIDDLKPDTVWIAVDAMARLPMKQALGELKLITSEALTELVKLPDWLVMPTLVRVLVNAFHEGQSLDAIIPPSLLTAPKEVHERLRESLSGARTLAALEKRIYQWADRLYYEVSFPSPPVKGNATLQPLRTGLMLRQEGRKMQNCVAGYAERVLDGESYFYAWRGKVRATVQLDHTREDRWVLAEALGVENEELPQLEWLRIVESLAQACGGAGLFLCRCSIAGSAYYDFDKALPTLSDNADLRLRREPTNPHDSNAIEVLTKDGLKLGHVPRSMNQDAASWMDAGLSVCARFLSNRGCRIELAVHATGDFN